MTYKVLITNAVPDDVLEPLCGLAEVIQGPVGGDLLPRREVLRLAPELDGIINQAELRVDAELLDHAPRLKIVANVAIGIDNLDTQLMAARGVWATNTPDVFAESTADCAFGLLLVLARRLLAADRYVRSGAWQSFQPGVWDGMLLDGKTIGIVGYGRIGRAVARRAQAFGMHVIFHDPVAVAEPGYVTLDDLLTQADVVSLHVPLTPQTRRLMDAQRLGQMKRGALLLNMARGTVLDEAALVAALQSGHLAGAGLDVFENEPAVHPALLTMDNVILTPHIGGGTIESRRAARRLCAENIALVLRGQRPLTPVNEPEAAR
jgi:glyoxylate reductase